MSDNTSTEENVKKDRSAYKKVLLFVWRLVLPRIILIGVLLCYLALGGCCFQFIESLGSVTEDSIDLKRHILVKQLWHESRSLCFEDWAHFAERMIVKQENYAINMKEKVSHSPQWSYAQSIFFCWTVVTTIGYGNIHPTSKPGRIFTIVYGTVGIPLTLILLADLGDILRKAVQKIRCWMRKRFLKIMKKFSRKARDPDGSKRSVEIEPEEEDLNVIHTLLILAVYALFGSIIFIRMESWDLLNSMYFIFVSLTTIGFGDIVPEHSEYVMLIIGYLLFGLVIMAMCLSTIQRQMYNSARKYLRKWRDWLRRKKEAAIAEEQDNDVIDVFDTVPEQNERLNNDENK